MKLICHPISPFARKAMILARIHGVEVEESLPKKDGANGYVAGDNPLGKIPALEWQPEQYLFDSPVICEYLDSLGDTKLLPAEGHERYLNLWQHALGVVCLKPFIITDMKPYGPKSCTGLRL